MKSVVSVMFAASIALMTVGLAACGGTGGGTSLPVLQLGPSPRPAPSSAPRPSPSPTPRPSPSPTPRPVPTPTPSQNSAEPPPPPSAYMADTWVGIHAMQVFDEDNYGPIHNFITQQQATTDGSRYALVWGPRVATAQAWHTNNSALRAAYYAPFDTDFSNGDFGNIGHGIVWWQTNHPSWVLYNCHSNGSPTQTPATASDLPNVVLDFSNVLAVEYQASTGGSFAEQNGYDAIAYDIVTLDNNTVQENGDYGCGVYRGPGFTQFHREFTGQNGDLAWSNAVVAWAAQSRAYLHRLSRPLWLVANNVPQRAAFGDPSESALLASVDILVDEAGFSNYGSYSDNAELTTTTQWAEYLQSLGKGFLVVDDWGGNSQSPTTAQLGYSIATYLLVKEEAAAFFVGAEAPYGAERWQNAYKAAIGSPCSPMALTGSSVFTRRYSSGFAAVDNDPDLPAVIALPAGHKYTDVQTGNTMSNSFTAQPHRGYVLTTTTVGCN